MTEEDVPQVATLLNSYLSQFEFRVVMSEEDVKHWLLPLEKVVYSYVVEVSFVVT